ncbi:hypothetical protein QN277_026968 [Acacia crassicarpa]|uniref:Uncharacterized protein n=1 Tax=Acacia crassicarpa TaxID=499986 RepID=A0AAE1MIE3_9FABA|nr:hypothetical protein QN277_026968 [Acacia crassicarpa]
MADPTTSQDTAKRKAIKESLFQKCLENFKRDFSLRKLQDAIGFGKQALLLCQELDKEDQAQEMHRILCSSYVHLSKHFQQLRDSEEALKSAKLALEHGKEVDNEDFRRMTDKQLAKLFLELRDFGEALIQGTKWLSHFGENDDSDEKHEARRTMASVYYSRASNFLDNKQFKEASGDGEKALLYCEDKLRTINIRWLLVQAYFSQDAFEYALEQFDSEPEMFLLEPELELNMEHYIKAGKIHEKMSRFNEAISYFEKAIGVAKRKWKKKEINGWIKDIKSIQKANKSIQEANEPIKDDIPPTLKDIGEIGIEKYENKKEIEEEQTFCHTEENIKKEASGDEGGPHAEDIKKEHCDAEITPFLRQE